MTKQISIFISGLLLLQTNSMLLSKELTAENKQDKAILQDKDIEFGEIKNKIKDILQDSAKNLLEGPIDSEKIRTAIKLCETELTKAGIEFSESSSKKAGPGIVLDVVDTEKEEAALKKINIIKEAINLLNKVLEKLTTKEVNPGNNQNQSTYQNTEKETQELVEFILKNIYPKKSRHMLTLAYSDKYKEKNLDHNTHAINLLKEKKLNKANIELAIKYCEKNIDIQSKARACSEVVDDWGTNSCDSKINKLREAIRVLKLVLV